MQPCSRAPETGPICSGPGCVVRNSSKCGPWGLCNPPSLPLSSVCYIFVLLLRGWGARGNSSPPQRRGVGHGINGDGIHEMTQWKWRFLGMFYAHMSIRLGLWQAWRAPANEGGRVEGDQPGCYCVICLVSHPREREGCASPGVCMGLRGSPRRAAHACKSGWLDRCLFCSVYGCWIYQKSWAALILWVNLLSMSTTWSAAEHESVPTYSPPCTMYTWTTHMMCTSQEVFVRLRASSRLPASMWNAPLMMRLMFASREWELSFVPKFV